MIEFAVVFGQGDELADLARSGKQSATRWVLYLIWMWFTAEFVGAFFGYVVGDLIGGDGLGLLVGYVTGLRPPSPPRGP